MTEQELQERYLAARRTLLDVLFWGAENLVDHDHVRASALVLLLDHKKMDVQAVISLNKQNASIKFDIEDADGGRTTILDIPIVISNGGQHEHE